jgi:hypothetical protein
MQNLPSVANSCQDFTASLTKKIRLFPDPSFLPLFELFGRNIGKLATPLGEAEGDDALLQQGDGVDHPAGQLLTHDPHNRLLNLQGHV